MSQMIPSALSSVAVPLVYLTGICLILAAVSFIIRKWARIAGILLGAGMATILRTAFGWTTSVDPFSIVVSFIFAAVVGIVFGVWPARRAASLDPIVALRYE